MNRKFYNALENQMAEEGKSVGTYREYFANVRYMEEFFKGKNFNEITEKDLKKYIKYLNHEYSKTTYNNHIAALRYLYKKVLKKPNMIEILSLKQIYEKVSSVEK